MASTASAANVTRRALAPDNSCARTGGGGVTVLSMPRVSTSTLEPLCRSGTKSTGGAAQQAQRYFETRLGGRRIRRIEILTLHLHDDPVQSAVTDYRQPRQLLRTVLKEGRARLGRQGVTSGEQCRHLFVGKTDRRHGGRPCLSLRGEWRPRDGGHPLTTLNTLLLDSPYPGSPPLAGGFSGSYAKCRAPISR